MNLWGVAAAALIALPVVGFGLYMLAESGIEAVLFVYGSTLAVVAFAFLIAWCVVQAGWF